MSCSETLSLLFASTRTIRLWSRQNVFRNSYVPMHSFSSSPGASSFNADSVCLRVKNGLPHLTVPLPSRDEKCVFVLRPVTHTVGDLLYMLKVEDTGIDRALVRNEEGFRVASATSIQTLLMQNSFFDLVVNDTTHRIQGHPLPDDKDYSVPIISSGLDDKQVERLGDVYGLVAQLYEAFHIRERLASNEQRLMQEIEALKDDLAPLEESRRVLAAQAEKRTKNVIWIGLGAMSVQFGILARLTWWEYSWDIMEPVTYFVTYGTAVACYAYFVLTKQDYLLPDVTKRQFLLTFFKCAKRQDWDSARYNSLKDAIAKAEKELRHLHNPPPPLRLLSTKMEVGVDGKAGLLKTHINMENLKKLLKV